MDTQNTPATQNSEPQFSQSETIGKLADALVTANGAMDNAKRTANNPFFKKKYAPLDVVISQVRPVLDHNGLTVTQWPCGETLVTMLLHRSGEWMRSAYALQALPDKSGKTGPQQYGSAITYARRYAIMAMFGIAPEDDDGEAAMSRDNGSTVQPSTKEPAQSAKSKISALVLDAEKDQLVETVAELRDSTDSTIKDKAWISIITHQVTGKPLIESFEQLEKVKEAIRSRKYDKDTGKLTVEAA